MREHNFQRCEYRKSLYPNKELWECKQCDSIVEVPAGMDIYVVNRFMANRLPCLEPMFEGNKADIIDNRTKIDKSKIERKIIDMRKNK